MTTASPWAGLTKCGLKPQLVEQEPTKPKAQRTAFDGPGTTSAVTLAVKPRQGVYRRGPGFIIASKAANQALTDKHRALRLTRI